MKLASIFHAIGSVINLTGRVQKIKINTIEDNMATVLKNMEECFGKFEVLIKMEPEIDPRD